MKRIILPDGYTNGLLVKTHRYMTRNRDAWWIAQINAWMGDSSYRTASEWFDWFYTRLTEKINRRNPARGKGNRAKRRMKALADARAECKWCGQPTGKASRHFCDTSCAHSYNGGY